MMEHDGKDGLDAQIQRVRDGARHTGGALITLATDYASRSNECLIGVIGAVPGGVTGMFVSNQLFELVGVASILCTGGCSVGGLAVGIFIHRGRGRSQMERAMTKFTAALSTYRRELNSLEQMPGVPADVVSELWTAYREAIRQFGNHVNGGRPPRGAE